MRPSAYFMTALLAAVPALGSAIPPGDRTAKKIVDLAESDMTPVPSGGLDRRGWLDCYPEVCKGESHTDCFDITANAGTCINLISSDGRPYVDAGCGHGCICTVYSEKGCPWFDGDAYSFSGPAEFSFHAQSIQCSIKV